MVRTSKNIALALASAASIFLTQLPAQAADTTPDPVGKAWKARAEAATKKLANPAGLDKCDKAVELAFQNPNLVTEGKKRSFELQIDIDKQSMVASYTYEGQQLGSFAVVELPLDWLAVLKPDSKALNILVQGAGCAFDLCTIDPFTTGPCADKGMR